ncbi:MAG: nicotinate (nicotinamide) nucleotide adenylyltransferase [Chloroflexi bacterium]|nr:nicotinate (nicotinamide) nucleotide adenylyltransferase [Chloroflexota bacterium]
MRRLGVLGGTFDPPHIGHLVLAEYAAAHLGLSHVLFVPAGDPPHKRYLTRASVEHRVAMVQAAIHGNTRFVLSRADVDRPGPHYTLDLMKIIQTQYPNVELYFLMGGDSFRDLPKWHHPEEIFKICRLGVMARPSNHHGDWDLRPDMHEERLPGLAACVEIIEAPLLDVAAVDIVERLRQQKTVRYLVPDVVLNYIKAHGLYEDQRA